MRDHTEVAMAGFARMHIKRRGARARQGRGYLARDMSALAHAGDDRAARGTVDEIDGGDKALVQRLAHCPQRISLKPEDTPRRIDVARGLCGFRVWFCGPGHGRLNRIV